MRNDSSDTTPKIERLAFSTSEVCAALGISRVTLWRIERTGAITRVPHVPGHPRYARREIERFLSGAEAKPAA